MNNNKGKPTQNQVINILEAVHTLSGDTNFLKKENGELCYTQGGYYPATPECPFAIPLPYLGDYKQPTHGKRKDPKTKFPKLNEEAEQGTISNKTLKGSFKKWVKNTPVLARNNNGQIDFFEGNAKSTARYNKKNYWKIHDHAKEMYEHGWVPYFLTWTFNPELTKGNIKEAWKKHTERVSYALKNLGKIIDIEYEIVQEATAKGYPHCHAIVWLKEWNEDDRIYHRKDKTYINGGWLKEYLRQYEPLIGYCELRRGDGKQAVNYLLKYISKSATKDFYKMAKDKNNPRPEDRKDMLTALMPVLSKTRQFKLSRLNNIEREQVGESSAEVQISEEKVLPFASRSDAFSYLKKLCNNSPLPCQNHIRFLSYAIATGKATLSLKEISNLSQEKKDEMFNYAGKTGCQGCILTKILEFIANLPENAFKESDDLKEILEIDEQNKNIEFSIPFKYDEHYKYLSAWRQKEYLEKKNRELKEGIELKALQNGTNYMSELLNSFINATEDFYFEEHTQYLMSHGGCPQIRY